MALTVFSDHCQETGTFEPSSSQPLQLHNILQMRMPQFHRQYLLKKILVGVKVSPIWKTIVNLDAVREGVINEKRMVGKHLDIQI